MEALTSETVYQDEIKKSRFIASALPIQTPEAALAYLERIRDVRATHHCWAYRIGQEYRFSDDGEPAGTAGRPILNAIERQAIDRVMVVVIRYYGGIKLGAGGLARAYGGCAAKCLQAADRQPIVTRVEIALEVGFGDIGGLYPVMDRFGAEKLEETYMEKGLAIRLRVDRTRLRPFLDALIEVSAGRIQCIDG